MKPVAPLQISDDLHLPIDAQTQTFGILAKRGSGKSYTAMVMAEEMLKAGLQLVAVDPVGVWWGLRSGADGKTAGLPIVIIGGEHADVPLDEGAGALIADLVIDQHISAVLDVSLLRKNEQKRFMLAFAEELYHRNRSPLHLFLDEADEWAPQKPQKGHERLLGAMEDIVRRGRARGIGATMITQRSAVLNKNVLTQIEVLVALRIVSPQDRAAIEEWIRVHGTPEQARELLGSLASLPIGTAWFWSPGWLDLFRRVKVRKRETFDSSATPEAGSAVVGPKVRAEVDLDALRAALAATIEKSKADDPKLLRGRIAELERQLATGSKAIVETKTVEVPVFSDADRAQQSNHVMAIGGLWERIRDEAENVLAHIADCVRRIDAFDEQGIRKVHTPVSRTVPESTGQYVPVRTERPVRTSAHAGDLGKPERMILTALAQHRAGCDKAQLGILSGYSSGSGHFNNILGKLRTLEFIGRGNPIEITAAGLRALGPFEPLPTGLALQTWWVARLGKPEAAILSALIAAYPRALSKATLGDRSGYSHTSGHFNNTLGKLRTLKLVTGYGEARAADALFDTHRRSV